MQKESAVGAFFLLPRLGRPGLLQERCMLDCCDILGGDNIDTGIGSVCHDDVTDFNRCFYLYMLNACTAPSARLFL